MRKEVHLNKKVIRKLQKHADDDKRSLKSFMEKILIEKSESPIIRAPKPLITNE